MSPHEIDSMDPILREFLEGIVRHMYRVSKQSIDIIRDAAQDENPARLQDHLVAIQGSVIDRVFTYIDGQSAPSHWPEIGLVNLESGNVLSGKLADSLAVVEGAFLVELDRNREEDN